MAHSREVPAGGWKRCRHLCCRPRSNVGRLCLLLVHLERVDDPVRVCEGAGIVGDEVSARVLTGDVAWELRTGTFTVTIAGQVTAEVGVEDDAVVLEVRIDIAGGVGIRHEVRCWKLEGVDRWAKLVRVGLSLLNAIRD